jgi:hypothetical protein
MTEPATHSIGTPGQAWGAPELALWRAQQVRRRSYADDVLAAVERLAGRFDVIPYGELSYGIERFPLLALRAGAWQAGLPGVLVTGGVHGYETSGVHGALRFLDQHAAEAYSGRVNLLVAPCVSPWAYERIHRWNFDAVDPNRSFRTPSPAPEAAALMGLVAPWLGQFAAHIDLHETTDTDETESSVPRWPREMANPSSPAASRMASTWWTTSRNPQPEFQQAIIDAVARVTHIAPADEKGEIIGCPEVAHGVIRYPLKAWGLCASLTGRALHHHHRGLPRQPPRHARAVHRRAGGGGGCGDRVRAGAGIALNRPFPVSPMSKNPSATHTLVRFLQSPFLGPLCQRLRGRQHRRLGRVTSAAWRARGSCSAPARRCLRSAAAPAPRRSRCRCSPAPTWPPTSRRR